MTAVLSVVGRCAQVEAAKLLSIKLINTGTLLYQLFRVQTSQSGDTITSVQDTSLLQARPRHLGKAQNYAASLTFHGRQSWEATCV